MTIRAIIASSTHLDSMHANHACCFVVAQVVQFETRVGASKTGRVHHGDPYSGRLQDSGSLFSSLVENTGKNAAKILKEMAQKSYARGESSNAYAMDVAVSPEGVLLSDIPPLSGVSSARSSPHQGDERGISGELMDASSTYAIAQGPPRSNVSFEGSSSDYFVTAPSSRCAAPARLLIY
jgi:hypothetical protein